MNQENKLLAKITASVAVITVVGWAIMLGGAIEGWTTGARIAIIIMVASGMIGWVVGWVIALEEEGAEVVVAVVGGALIGWIIGIIAMIIAEAMDEVIAVVIVASIAWGGAIVMILAARKIAKAMARKARKNKEERNRK